MFNVLRSYNAMKLRLHEFGYIPVTSVPIQKCMHACVYIDFRSIHTNMHELINLIVMHAVY